MNQKLRHRSVSHALFKRWRVIRSSRTLLTHIIEFYIMTNTLNTTMNHCEFEEVTQHINDKISMIKRLLELRAVAKDPDKRGTLIKIEQEVNTINELLDRFERYVGQQRDLLKHLKDLEEFFQEDEEDAQHLKNNTPMHMPRKGQQAPQERGQVAGQSRQTDALSAPQEHAPPRKQRNQIKEMEFITVQEFDSIPPYMKGRVTYDQLNGAVQSINATVTAKYKILYQPMKSLNNSSRTLQQRFKDQETKDTKGQFFIVEQDIREFAQLKVDKRFVGMLNMLRHCQRLKEVRGGGVTRLILLKKTLLLNNMVAICGAILMLLSKTALSFEMIIVGRIIYGINAGVSLVVHTLFILECAPKRLRGMVGVSVSFFVSFGKFTGQLLGISELLGTEERWIWLLAFSGVTGLLQLLTLPFLPESPRYLLLERADRHGCEMALRRLWGAKKDPKPDMEDMFAEHAALKGVKIHRLKDLFLDVNVRWQLLTIIVTFVTLQLCGINGVYLYSFDVFQAAGIPEENLRYAALGTGLCEISTSIACVLMIESTGKRVLLYRGYLGMASALALLTVTLYLQGFVSWMPYCSMVLIFIYILFFSSGPAGVTAPLPGEIFTQSYKPPAFTVACTLNWVGLFLVGMLFPLIVKHLDYFCFLIFFVFCFFSGMFVWFNVPETKNKTVLEITEDFNIMHQKPRCPLQSKLDLVHINDIQDNVFTKL